MEGVQCTLPDSPVSVRNRSSHSTLPLHGCICLSSRNVMRNVRRIRYRIGKTFQNKPWYTEIICRFRHHTMQISWQHAVDDQASTYGFRPPYSAGILQSHGRCSPGQQPTTDGCVLQQQNVYRIHWVVSPWGFHPQQIRTNNDRRLALRRLETPVCLAQYSVTFLEMLAQLSSITYFYYLR